MTPRTWAEQEGRRLFAQAVQFWRKKGHALNDHWEKATDSERECFTLVATQAHARAVRIVEGYMKRYGTEGSPCELICRDILAALQKGRTTR